MYDVTQKWRLINTATLHYEAWHAVASRRLFRGEFADSVNDIIIDNGSDLQYPPVSVETMFAAAVGSD